ncbi:extracellular solute-binding protein [Kribbella antibiotica]|uniref:Extracellular solute-binding protein n=1 Tax=Kribbella antibiotica TaxID=190195 RepID=A0A4R4YQJ2_9ACTN|nr:extracellular solute-binding protein [Kribbella antibiotica]TDD46880.1 extracellular solute-binding protein [Kribbella antibiotica]
MVTRKRFKAAGALAASALLLAVSACSQGSSTKQPESGGQSSGPANIKIAYQQWGPGTTMKTFLAGVKSEYEAANPGSTVEVLPIVASENDYYTKLQLMMRSPNTAPDVVYEDTFLINSDITAGYLRPLDEYIGKWDQWSQFQDSAKGAAKALDGKTYGVPDGTDTRALWYNKEIFAKAGLPTDWQPKTWDDVLSAARTIKAKVPGVTPFNIYSGKPMGEGSAMQGFEMLLYGTKDTLYNNDQQKWVVGSQGFKDSLNFIKTVFDKNEGIGPTPKQALDPNMGSKVGTELLPGGKLGIALDGSWIYGNWQKTGAKPWPEWSKVMGQTAMPTQDGSGKGKVSLSGGWTWAIPAKSKNPDAAWNLIKTLQTPKNAAKYATDGAQIAVRKDVAEDASYKTSSESTKFFTDLVSVTVYRPAYAEYPKVSNEIITAMEAVMTGQSSVDDAAKNYDEAVEGIVGKDKTTSGQ